MSVLVINVGSTSVKYDLFEVARGSEQELVNDTIEHVGTTGEVEAALATIATALGDRAAGVTAVGHRVVHGGEQLTQPVVIDALVEQAIEACAVFAPLHNPVNLFGIRAARRAFPTARHVAVFDTAFHATMPPHAFRYALPAALYREHGVRRYGFHGPSHQFMAARAAAELALPLDQLRVVTCHLGGGASVAAIDRGISVDTSMGMTPLEGLVMATRSGDLDPAIALVLARKGYSTDALDELFNRKSGLAGLSGLGSDFRELEAAAERGDAGARLAIDVFVHRLQKYIGAYAAVLGGADAIVFAGGIGEGSAQVRERACRGLGFMGVALDTGRNRSAQPTASGGCVDVSLPHAHARVLVVHTEEERMICREVVGCLASAG